MSDVDRGWFRRPQWVDNWEAWRDAANEVADLGGERLPWPYNPEPPSAFSQLIAMSYAILAEAKGPPGGTG